MFGWSKLRALLFAATGQPSTPLLSEEEFVSLAHSAGLDWRRTLAQLRTSYGVSRYYDWIDVVQLPRRSALLGRPLDFYVHYSEAASDYPPKRYECDFNQYSNARKNFAALYGTLSARLGAGERRDTSNCLVCNWRIGECEIELFAWPPELNRNSTNLLHQRAPDTRHLARLAISRRISLLLPDPSLVEILSLPPDAQRLIGETPGISWRVGRYEWNATKNPTSFRPGSERNPLIWRDSVRGRFGLSGSDVTWIFNTEFQSTLELYDCAPARGPGYGELSIIVTRPSGDVLRCQLAGASTASTLRARASELSEFWQIKLNHVSGLDD